MRSIFILLPFLVIISSFSPPETIPAKLRFKVLKNDKEIGWINATKTISGNQILYEVETELEIKLVFTQKVVYSSKALYVNNFLQKSVSKSFVNKKLQHHCVTLWKGNHYEIKRDHDIERLDRKVFYSGIMLYFKEPGDEHLVYSEMAGQDNFMAKGDGVYLLTDGKSKRKNSYWYKGGLLHKAFIDHSLVDFEIIRVRQ